MCGIAGIVSPQKIFNEDINKALKQLEKRGPDASGAINFGIDKKNAAFLHRRLSIMDLSDSANQPFVDNEENPNIILVFNGEIYNFIELRAKLEAKGVSFRTNSDTEVILKLYQQKGISCVEDLRGMFSVAIFDRKKEEVYLVRDRMGQKPLYFYNQNGVFAFASTIKAMLSFRDIKVDFNFQAFNDYFTFNYNPDNEKTFFDTIYKLPPASVLKLSKGKISVSKYWQLKYEPKIDATYQDIKTKTTELIKDSVKHRLISDVPLGFFLSGGVDSSLLVAMASELGQKVKTFSIGFMENDFSELPFASKIAKQFDTEHHEFVLSPDIVKSLDRVISELDEPMADPSSLPLLYLAQETRKYVTVAINGDGGDELFAGYERYLGNVYIRKAKLFPYSLRRFLLKSVSKQKMNNKRVSFTRRLKWLLENSLEEDSYFNSEIALDLIGKNMLFQDDFFHQYGRDHNIFAKYNDINAMDRLLQIDSEIYLPEDLLVKADRMTMAHSLEGRSPFLDHILIDYVTKVDPNHKLKINKLKYLLKDIAGDYLGKDIVNRKKQGFGLPLNKWFREDLKQYFMEIMRDSSLVSDGILSFEGIQVFYNQHQVASANHGRQLLTLLIAEKWYTNIKSIKGANE